MVGVASAPGMLLVIGSYLYVEHLHHVCWRTVMLCCMSNDVHGVQTHCVVYHI